MSITAVPEATTLPLIASPNPSFELLHEVRRKTVRKRREGALEHDSHQLPVSSHGVLAGGSLRHPAMGPERRCGRLDAVQCARRATDRAQRGWGC